jgi:hypothetical protein
MPFERNHASSTTTLTITACNVSGAERKNLSQRRRRCALGQKLGSRKFFFERRRLRVAKCQDSCKEKTARQSLHNASSDCSFS